MHQFDKPTSQRPVTERRILIVDDHPLVRRGLPALIDGEPDLAVCARVAGRREALAAIASSRPDLVITELSFGDGAGTDGLTLVREIRPGHGELPVLVLSGLEAPVYAERALRAGTGGYASKGETGETILVAIRAVLDGGRFVSAKLRAGLDAT